jgi:hypothetical protein
MHSRRTTHLLLAEMSYIDAEGRIEAARDYKCLAQGGHYFSVVEHRNKRLSSMQCWALPSLNVRVCTWQLATGISKLPRDFDWYVDACEFEIRANRVVMRTAMWTFRYGMTV